MNEKILPFKDRRYFYGYQRQNYYQKFSYLQKQKVVVHLITPSGLARITTLQQKAQIILGTLIIQVKGSYQLHPFFEFLLKKTIFSQYINHPKIIEELPTILYPYQQFQDQTQMMTQNQQQQPIIQIQIDKSKTQNPKEQFLKTKFIQFLKFFKQNLDEQIYKSQVNKIQKLQCLQLGLQRLQEEALQKYFQSQFHKQTQKSLQQIFFLLDNIKKIIFIRFQQQIIRLNIAQRKYNIFFNLNLIKDKQTIEDFNQIYQNIAKNKEYCEAYKNIKVTINRIVKQPSQIIYSIMDLVDMRSQNCNYKPQSIILIKDIFIQLLQFNRNTTKSFQKSFYYFLDHQNVLYDQLTLKPQLSYRPILLDMFNVLNRPMSVQNKLCLEPSPQRYFNFQSTFEMNPYNKLILQDPYYGSKQFYDYHNEERSDVVARAILYEQEQQLQILHERIQVQRYLYLSYYILNSKELSYRQGNYTTLQRKKYFASKAKKYQAQLHKNSAQLWFYLGKHNSNFQKRMFNYSNQQILQYLQIQQFNEAQLIEDTNNLRVKKLKNLKNQLMKDIIKYVLNQHFFTTICPIIKYMFIFFLIAAELFMNAQLLFDQEKVKKIKGGRKKMRKFLLSNIKKDNNYRKVWGYIDTLYEKVESVLTKQSPQKYLQIKYMLEDKMAISYRGYMRLIHKQLHDLKLIQNDLNQLQESETFSAESRSYQSVLRKLQTNLKNNCKKIKDIVKQSNFYYFSYETNLRQLVKRRDPAFQFEKRYFQIVTRKINIMVHSFVSVDESNLIIYQSIVHPFTCINKNGKKRIQIPKRFQEVRRQIIDQQFSYIYQIIDYKIIQDPAYFPKRVKKYKVPQKLQQQPPSKNEVYLNKKVQKHLLAIQPDYNLYHPLYSKKADPSKVQKFAPSKQYRKKFSFFANLLDIQPYDPKQYYMLQDINMPQIQQQIQIKPNNQDQIIID